MISLDLLVSGVENTAYVPANESQISLIDHHQNRDQDIALAQAAENISNSDMLIAYEPRDFTKEFKYSLWTDLCGE